MNETIGIIIAFFLGSTCGILAIALFIGSRPVCRHCVNGVDDDPETRIPEELLPMIGGKRVPSKSKF